MYRLMSIFIVLALIVIINRKGDITEITFQQDDEKETIQVPTEVDGDAMIVKASKQVKMKFPVNTVFDFKNYSNPVAVASYSLPANCSPRG